MAEEATVAEATQGDTGGASAALHPSATPEVAEAAPAQAEPASEAPAEAPADNPAEADNKEAEAQPKLAIDPNFKMPDGMELDADVANKFVPLAQEMNLNQEQAQQLADFYAAEKARMVQAQVDGWEKTNAEWVEQVHSDQEIGGEKLDESVGFANKALDKYGTPELKEALASTGAGNHPEFIRFMTRVGKAMSEDTIGVGTAGPAGRSNGDRAKILFPNHK